MIGLRDSDGIGGVLSDNDRLPLSHQRWTAHQEILLCQTHIGVNAEPIIPVQEVDSSLFPPPFFPSSSAVDKHK